MNPRDISILVADDDDNIRLIVANYLSKLGFTTTSVADGAQALESLKKLSFDICVLDVRMPHLDGIALVDSVIAANPECRVLFITGEADDREIDRIHRERIGVAVLRKPFKIDALKRYVEMIAEGIDIRRKEQLLEAHRRARLAALTPARRLCYHAGQALRRLHETYVIYTLIAAIIVAASIMVVLDRVYASGEHEEKSISVMYDNVMQVLERWEKEDTRRDRR